MDEVIRWGICGTGSIAGSFVKSLAAVDDAHVVAVASHDADRGRAFAEAHGIERAHVGYEALATDDEVDVVYVASTQERHVDDTLLFLEGGRHVLCEKPFALSVADAERMVAAATDAQRFLMEALWSRFQPSYVRLAELLAEGAIGQPRRVRADFSMRVPDDGIEGHRLFDLARGGGALMDLGVYPVQLAHLVFGAPDRVEAVGWLTDGGVDEQTSVLLGWDGGASALLTAAIRTSGPLDAVIIGSEGSLALAPFMHCTNQLTLERGGETEVMDFEGPSLHHQVPEVHRCLRAGLLESSVMPHAETLAIMRTLETALHQVGVEYP